MPQKAIDHAHSQHETYLDELKDFLSIPSISTLPENKDDMERTAQWVADKMGAAGLENVQIMPTEGHPVVYGDWLHARDDASTVLIYGHYDVQPVDPLDLWESKPFDPEIRDGEIYARGSSDDKGQMFIHIKAVGSVLAAEGKLPINIKMIFEGEEEIGSPSLETFVLNHKELLAADSGLVSDGRILSSEQPSMCYALRGLCYMEVLIKGPKRDLHSGSYGGSVHNPGQVIGEIIAAMHDENGTIQIPGFYDKVRDLSDEERAALKKVPYGLEQWQSETGLEKAWGEAEYTILERSSARPTCEVNGIWGGFQGEGSKTIIPAEAGTKISMRLVPDQDPDEIAELFEAYVRDLASDAVEVEIIKHTGGWPAITPIDSKEVKAAAKAYESAWGKTPVFTREGGSIPIVATFQKELDAPVVLMGFGLDDNIHSPNEHFRLSHFYQGIDASIYYMYYLAA